MEEKVIERFRDFVEKHVTLPAREFVKKLEGFWKKLAPREKAALFLWVTSVPVYAISPLLAGYMGIAGSILGFFEGKRGSPELEKGLSELERALYAGKYTEIAAI